jgi:4-carboxymuconolactone decarboxylase
MSDSEAKPNGHGRPEADPPHQDAGQDAPRGYSEGMKTRREVLGDEHVDRALANTTPFTEPFQDFITRYAWGEIWSRPGLDRKTRSCITLAALVSLGAENEIAMHVRAARRNGLTPDEIAEVILHTALYAGVPRANSAFAIAKEVLEG